MLVAAEVEGGSGGAVVSCTDHDESTRHCQEWARVGICWVRRYWWNAFSSRARVFSSRGT